MKRIYDTKSLVSEARCVLSDDELHRLWLSRVVGRRGKIVVFIGVNPSKADAEVPDQTDKKWRVFGRLNGARIVVYVNLFTLRATEVSDLRGAEEVNDMSANGWLSCAFSVADLIVPCWGSRHKIPTALHGRIEEVEEMLKHYAAPIRVFGLTKSGDPKHCLMLGYSTKLVSWRPYAD